MIEKQTPWERENLGVRSSVVFQFEDGDDVKCLPESIADNHFYEYQEAVVPMGKVELLNRLLKAGFSFAEVAMHISANLEKIVVPSMFKRRLTDLSYHRSTADEWLLINEAMRKGEIFVTDKIALNGRFGPKVAGRRYALWSEKEINAGNAIPYIVEYREEKVGFFILKKVNDRTADGMLSGMFDTSKSMGLGFSVVYYPMVEARMMGMTKLVTTVSSNNPSIYKINQQMGFMIQQMDYILYKLV